VASRASAREIESWAQRIEHFAFGPEVVDEKREQEVRANEPKGGH
jgi:hypothetical protein